jgi:hypothetical protein
LWLYGIAAEYAPSTPDLKSALIPGGAVCPRVGDQCVSALAGQKSARYAF